MSNAVIVGYARSPFTKAGRGALANTRPDDVAAQVITGLVQKLDLDVATIEDLLMGCAYPEGEQGLNIGRNVTYLSGLPRSVAGVTINRLCGSSMQAIHNAAGSIALGSGDAFLCGGIESMSRIKRGGFARSTNSILDESYPEAYISMGITAENVAKKYSISREEQEIMALDSHKKSSIAQREDRFKNELVAIPTTDGDAKVDECIRPDTTLESMAKLRPAFVEDGTVTAATSSPLTDGAAFTFVCSENYADEHSLKPLARIIGCSVAGCPPEIMGVGPINSTRKILSKVKLDIDEMDIIELNEAFASQSLAVMSELDINPAKLNVHGGAISIGHPLGASGARITGKAASLLNDRGGKYALATMCIGGGMGISTILENIN